MTSDSNEKQTPKWLKVGLWIYAFVGTSILALVIASYFWMQSTVR